MSHLGRLRLARFLSTFVSAWLSFRLLNRGKADRVRKVRRGSEAAEGSAMVEPENESVEPGRRSLAGQSLVLAGRTMDLTLFSASRAIDICVGELWSRYRARRMAKGRWTRLESLTTNLTDVGVFSVSACVVMWAWFYLPERLPRSYNKWIGEAAQVDERLIEALRQARRGDWIYGRDTGQAGLLESMCRDYNWPLIVWRFSE